ncbi:hypothetical protein EDWATA_00304 [Edwardsiella tarda ATCC 23685]|uniref:Uncharacterized protein n=1 Tax=Edwardsiella tarda ATCC 23685 TaxID=500638 RepID=D4F0S6_EDWTA|nr:hypothetical protein EDWATA_00304 [Edwardsiella tarda ATCC 23685]
MAEKTASGAPFAAFSANRIGEENLPLRPLTALGSIHTRFSGCFIHGFDGSF